MRLLRFSGLPCAQVFLKSIKRAFVSESSNGGAVKVIGAQARDERSEQIAMVIIRIRIGYLIPRKHRREVGGC